VFFLYLVEYAVSGFLVLQLYLDGEALLAGNVVGHAGDGAVGDVD
jgi:hypothetical protein